VQERGNGSKDVVVPGNPDGLVSCASRQRRICWCASARQLQGQRACQRIPACFLIIAAMHPPSSLGLLYVREFFVYFIVQNIGELISNIHCGRSERDRIRTAKHQSACMHPGWSTEKVSVTEKPAVGQAGSCMVSIQEVSEHWYCSRCPGADWVLLQDRQEFCDVDLILYLLGLTKVILRLV
jgi:hypothetical protein